VIQRKLKDVQEDNSGDRVENTLTGNRSL
jgi:hypothetical protein